MRNKVECPLFRSSVKYNVPISGQVTRNVKRWPNAAMALRWTTAGMLEAQKTFRRLQAYRQLPILKAALQAPAAPASQEDIEPSATAA